jgi:5'-nucleotidase
LSTFKGTTSLVILISIIIGTFGFTVQSSDLFTSPQSTSKNDVHVQLLVVNDFHGQLDKYHTVLGTVTGGAEYLAAYLKKYKKVNPSTILIHAGDMTGASPPISSQFRDQPTIEFMNILHFDVGTLGNHEFDHGVNAMKHLIYGGYNQKTGYFQGTKTAYISANIIDKKTNSPLFPPYFIKHIDGMKIGFIGVVTTETNHYVTPENRQQVNIIDEVSAINRTVKVLKDKGVKAIVVLAHISAKSDLTGGNPIGALVKMAPQIDKEVDVIFAGHSHDYANTVADGKLIVQALAYGKAFSQVNITIDRKTKDIVEKNAKIILTSHDQIEPDSQTHAFLKKYKQKLGKKFYKNIGKLPWDVTRYHDVNGNSPLAKMIAEAERKAMGTEIAFVHQGEMRGNLKKGNITLLDLYTALPFGHTVKKILLTGKQIKLALEQQWRGKSAPYMLQTLGLTYNWDPEASIGNHILSIKDSNSQELQPDKEYYVALSNFLASGGDKFTAFRKGRTIKTGPLVVEALSNFIKQNYPLKGTAQ